jgi:hypothetical protein
LDAILTGKLFSLSCNSHSDEREAGGPESEGFPNIPFGNTIRCAVRTRFVCVCWLCLNYLPARYFMCLLIHRKLSLYILAMHCFRQHRSTEMYPSPPLTTYINLEIFSSPVVSSYFVGNYFSFDTLDLQYEFQVQLARSIEI